jgi:hypothetical protein
VTGDIQVPSALLQKLPSELALGGELALADEPLEASRSSQEGLIARLERLLQRMGTPVVQQRPDADGQGLVSDTASRIANLSLPGRSAWLPPPWRQPAWPAMAGRSAWTGPTASTTEGPSSGLARWLAVSVARRRQLRR